MERSTLGTQEREHRQRTRISYEGRPKSLQLFILNRSQEDNDALRDRMAPAQRMQLTASGPLGMVPTDSPPWPMLLTHRPFPHPD